MQGIPAKSSKRAATVAEYRFQNMILERSGVRRQAVLDSRADFLSYGFRLS